jgi:hypothetical protein
VAKADEYSNFIQFTCSKELDYFAIRTMKINDAHLYRDGTNTDNSPQLNIFDIRNLSERPYNCKLPTRSISVSASTSNTKQNTSTSCVDPPVNVSIHVEDTKEVYNFAAYGISCGGSETHLVELQQIFSLRDCVMPDGPGQASCTYPSLKIAN